MQVHHRLSWRTLLQSFKPLGGILFELGVPQNFHELISIFKLSGAITPKISRGDNQKYAGAPQVILENTSTKFQASRWNTF